MLIEDFPNSRTTFQGFSLLHQQPILYPITPPHHHSPPYQEIRGHNEIDHHLMNHRNHEDGSYKLQKMHYYASLTPPTFYPTLYPSPPQSISPPSQTLQQLISFRKHATVKYDCSSGSERFMLDSDNDTYNRRNSVIMKVQDQMIVPTIKLSTPTAKIASDSDEENFVCKWISCFSIFDTLEALAAHVTQCHAIASLDGLYHCKWQSCPRSDRGFNARYKMLVHCKQLRKSEMFQLGHLMDSVTLIGSNAIPFKYNTSADSLNYRIHEWDRIDEPLDLSIHKVVRS